MTRRHPRESDALPQASGREEGTFPVVAIVGMAGRFPECDSIEDLWELVASKREGITTLTDAELVEAGVTQELWEHPNYVRRRGSLRDPEGFDADFFGLAPAEAALLDAQQRTFLECAWAAVEDTGYDIDKIASISGVFASGNSNGFPENMDSYLQQGDSLGVHLLEIGNLVDMIPTRVAYHLGLQGPAFAVQAGCAGGLVAVHVAARALHASECDLAIAGAVGIDVPKSGGYLFQENGILSFDGRCRPFDRHASGIVPGDGVAVIVLKRISDAQRDGDRVYATIDGSAVNNDGGGRRSFASPNATSQGLVITRAMALAGVTKSDIQLIEAHGSATKVGDLAEVAGLSRVFSGTASPCALGSVKSNLGHLGSAAGMAGLVKAASALYRRVIPPMAGKPEPDPALDLSAAGLYLAEECEVWPSVDGRLGGAGVSSFSVGGTNAHIVLRSAWEDAVPSTDAQSVIVLSGRNDDALHKQAVALRDYLSNRAPDIPIRDIAFTLQTGRRHFHHRLGQVVDPYGDAVAALDRRIQLLDDNVVVADAPHAVFLLPDLAQSDVWIRPLLGSSGVLEEALGCAVAFEGLECDPGAVLSGTEVANAGPVGRIAAAAFCLTVGASRVLMSLGVQPTALVGIGLGEWSSMALSEMITPRMLALLFDAAAAIEWAELSGAKADGRALVERFQHEARSRGVRDVWESPRIPFMSGLTNEWMRSDDWHGPIDYLGRLITSDAPAGELSLSRVLSSHRNSLLVEVGYPSSVDGSPSSTLRPPISSSDESTSRADLVLETVASWWTRGGQVDWAKLQSEPHHRRVHLPTYPFTHKDPKTPEPSRLGRSAERRPLARLQLSVPKATKLARLRSDVTRASSGYWLFLHDDSESAREFVRYASEHEVPISAVPLTTIRRADASLTTSSESFYKCVANHSELRGGFPDKIIHYAMAETTLRDDYQVDAVQRELSMRFDALVHLCQAVGRVDSGRHTIELVVIAPRAFPSPDREDSNPMAAVSRAVMSALPLEFPGLTGRVIEMDRSVTSASLLAELATGGDTPRRVALTGGTRWVETLVPLSLGEQAPDTSRFNGSVLLTGGTGGIGRLLGKAFLDSSPEVRVTLLSRRGASDRGARDFLNNLPPRDRERVLVLAADVSDVAAVSEVVDSVDRAFGGIDGVIHCAGTPGVGSMHHMDVARARETFRAKIFGTLALASHLRTRRLDFFVCFSSIDALSVPFGGADYAAANSFMDSFARFSRDSAWPLISVNWDAWTGVGMDKMAVASEGGMDASVAAAAVLDIAMWADVLPAQIVVAAPDTSLAPESATATIRPRPVISEELGSLPMHDSRLETTPKTPVRIDTIVVAVWAEMLGSEDEDSDFFDLGGNSLLAARMIATLQRDLQIHIPIETLYLNSRLGSFLEVLRNPYP